MQTNEFAINVGDMEADHMLKLDKTSGDDGLESCVEMRKTFFTGSD